MKKRTNKKEFSIKKYTAFAPKTIRSTKKISSAVVKKINNIFCMARKTFKKTTKMIDKKTAQSIRTFTKKHVRK